MIRGQNLFIFIAGVAVAHSTSYTLSLTRTNKVIASKDSADYVNRQKGRVAITASVTGLAVYGGNIDTLMTAQANGTPLMVSFGEKLMSAIDSTKSTKQGQFYMTSLELTANDGDNATYTANLECNGQFTYTKK